MPRSSTDLSWVWPTKSEVLGDFLHLMVFYQQTPMFKIIFNIYIIFGGLVYVLPRLNYQMTFKTIGVGYKYVSVVIFLFKYIQKHVFVSVFAIFKICVFVLVFDHCI